MKRPGQGTGIVTGRALAALAVLLALPGPLAAAELTIPAGGRALAEAVASAAPGDVLRLEAGDHRGPLLIDRPLTLEGREDARIVGTGEGRVVTLDAPGIVLRGVTVTGSGLKLESEDSGIFATQEARGARIEANRLENNLIGIYLKGAAGAQVRDNVILGRQDLRMNERGNGIQIWNAPGAEISGNRVRYGRDGIFVTTSKDNVFQGNDFRDLRFAIHYMYTNDSQILDNRSSGNHVGYALMYSRGLTVSGNRSRADRDHGILLNYANGSEISANRVEGGTKKCVFIYNANKNRFRRNLFRDCEIGIHFTAGSERNVISENAFLANRTQVKYVGTRYVEWSQGGRGNYWSDNSAIDLDGDGIADRAYRPNDLVDQIVWRHPLAKLLLMSPAAQILQWAQSAFPTLFPGGVVDSHPLLSLPGAEPPIRGATS